MTQHQSRACPEYYSLSRRQFMQRSSLAAMAAAAAPAWLPRIAYGDGPRTSTDVVVSIFLRGAADGLSMVVPYGDPVYYQKRPTLGVLAPDSANPTTTCTNLNGFFGLSPAMSALAEPYANGHLAVVHGAGLTDGTRSHFDAQRFMELGKANDANVFTGWLGRHLTSIPAFNTNALIRAIGIGYALQTQLAGGPLSLPVPDLARYTLTGLSTTRTARQNALNAMYNAVQDVTRASAQNTQSTMGLLGAINFNGYVPGGGAVYPSGSFAYSLKTTAALIKAQVGVEAVAIDKGGWDTHSAQGVLSGSMATSMADLANGLRAFYRDMIAFTNNVTVIVMSEFGRRVQENGSFGTDHGHGNCMFVMGGNVNGGRVYQTGWHVGAENPTAQGLGALYQNLDLNVGIDYREVVSEIIARRLQNPTALSTIFPGYTAPTTWRGIVR